MGIRTYSLFFLALPAYAADVTSSSQSTTIPPVIVSAIKKSQTTLTSGPKMTITRDQLTTTGVTTLSDALSELGGIQLQDMAGNGSQVLLGMRGFGANASSNTLLLVNGIPITNPDLAPPDLNAIPLHEIEYIEIISGSESVLYGDQAVAGSINIVTRKPEDKKLEASCGIGSYDQRTCYAAWNHHYRNLRYSISASRNQTDNYRVHNDYDQNLLLGTFDYPYQTGRILFDYKIANERMQYPGPLTALQVRQNRRQANNDIDFFTDWNGFFHLRHQQQFTSNWRLETDLTRRETHGHGVLSSPFTQNRVLYFLKPTLKGTVNNATLVNGIELQEDNYRLNSPFFITHNSQQKFGAFSMATIPIYQRLSLSIGARAAQQDSHLISSTDNNMINRALATTLGTTYQLSPNTQFYLRRAGSFRFPKADENASTASGVTNLRTQRGVAYETGFLWDKNTYSAKIGIYQLNLRDEIAFDPLQTPEQPFGSNRNLAPTVRRGFTLSGKNDLTDKLTLGGQYNYVNARFQSGINSGNRIPLVSENLFRASVNYKLTQTITAYTEAVFTGNQYADNDDANIAGKIGGYTVYNLNFRYQIKQFEASLRFNNIFNKAYYFYTVYQSSMQTEFFYPAPERNFVFSLRYTFA